MRTFIWKEVEYCSNRYHSCGGVVVIAGDEERARELANKEDGCKIKKSEDVDHSYKCSAQHECVYIFPDAGCC